jgi:hypothetical protein
MNEIKDAIDIAKLLIDIVKLVMEAVQGGNIAKVDEVLPETLRISLARAKAELVAAKKFGPRPE